MPLKLSEYDVLKAVKERKISLTEAIAVEGFRSQPVSAFPSVKGYLAEIFAKFSKILPETSLTHLEPNWYLLRGEAVHGPLSFDAISRLRKKESLRVGDLCVSLNLELKFDPFELKFDADNADKRIYVRQPIHEVVTIQRDTERFQCMAFDISAGGIGLYLKSPLRAGESVRVRFGSTNDFVHAVVGNIQPKKSGLRCGLRFVSGF